jgi:hypothetical protein
MPAKEAPGTVRFHSNGTAKRFHLSGSRFSALEARHFAWRRSFFLIGK